MSRVSDFVPKYRLVYDDLRQQIMDGHWALGARLPKEIELCEEYGINRVTVRRALDLLQEAGLAEKRRGLGCFVTADHRKKDSVVFAMRRSPNDIRHNTNAFNAMLFFLMEQACHDRGINLQYAGLDDTAWQPDESTACVMLVSRHDDAVANALFEKNVPILCINHLDPRAISFLPDNQGGIASAVEHLLDLGHRKLGFISGPKDHVNSLERLAGFVEALRGRGITIREEWIMPGDWTSQGGGEAMHNLLALSDSPTAIITASDMMAIGAIDSARQAGKVVPQDVSVVGFDNISTGLYCAPALTTVGVDAQQLAQLAVETMLRVSESPFRTCDRYAVRLPTTLQIRGSTGPAHRQSTSD